MAKSKKSKAAKKKVGASAPEAPNQSNPDASSSSAAAAVTDEPSGAREPSVEAPEVPREPENEGQNDGHPLSSLLSISTEDFTSTFETPKELRVVEAKASPSPVPSSAGPEMSKSKDLDIPSE